MLKKWRLVSYMTDMGLSILGKIVESIVSFIANIGLSRLWTWIKPPEEEKAFKRAMKKWKKHFNLRGKYDKQSQLKSISGFCHYVITHHGVYDQSIDSLHDFFEEELKKTHEGQQFLEGLRTKALNKDVYESLIKADEILVELKSMHEMQEAILKELNTHNKGKREFDPVPGYIQRYCTQRLKSDEVFSYLLEHKTFEKYRLVDVVSGRTECKGNKFILYSDAQTGKTTELLQLGWELQEEKRLIPILFKVKGCQDIRQELPALNKQIEKGLVVIIDALDEKFEGDARFNLYREVESYGEEHPHLNIVLTCRANYSGEYTFNEFNELNLSDLSWQDSLGFLNKEGVGHIAEEIERERLYEFVRTPFYLIALVDYYKEKEALPENKGELYEFFIDRRLDQEEKLRLKQNSEMTSRGKMLLGKMAVAIQLMGANFIMKEELLTLFDNNYEDYNRVLRTGLTEPVEQDGCSFTHNSFKEFFVSRYLLKLDSFEEIQNLSCYRGTQIVKVGWYNTIALLLSQLPKESELSKQILEWIVNDNKNMVLHIDRKMFDEKRRTDIFKDIIEWHKSKYLRIADFSSSNYEDLMNFGCTAESIDYLMNELLGCYEIDNHAANILFLLRYIRSEYLSTQKATELRTLLLDVFMKFKDDAEHIYVLFEAFESPWLKNEENADAIYEIEKDSEHPNIVNHLVEYITESGCAEKYVDVIIEKGHFIQEYNNDGYIRIIRRDDLYKAYQALTTWDSIKKVLAQLKEEFMKHLYWTSDEEKFEEIVGKMLGKVEGLVAEHPDAPDFVYEMLLEMAEERSAFKKFEKDAFFEFFEHTEMTQHYFDVSMETLKGYFLDNSITWSNYDEHKKIESKAYCAGLMLDEERLNQVVAMIDLGNPNGNSLLLCLSQYASEDIQKQIEAIRKKRYPQYWHDKNAPTKWEIREQQDYDELMDYERFKRKVLKILEEKTPKNKEDMKQLRNTKVKFSEDEEDSISHYVFGVFYLFYDQAMDTFNLENVREYIGNYSNYQKYVVSKTAEHLYSDHNKIKINEEQKQLFKVAVVDWLCELAKKPSHPEPISSLQAIMVLLHHDVNIDDEMVLKLLPYTYCHIYLRTDIINGYYYSLFDYACERYVNRKSELLNAVRNYMDLPVVYPVQNLKEWCLYLIKNRVSSEYDRVINIMLSLPCEDPAICIAQTLIDQEETRPMVLKDNILKRCGAEKRLYIYEQLSSDENMDEFVRCGIENDLDELDNGNKERAVRLSLLKGSMKGLEYLEGNIHIIDIRSDLRKYSLNALPLLLNIYLKAIDNLHHSDYGGILNAVEVIARETDEGWEKVNEAFAELIENDEKKFRHLNWYLRDWSVKRMEKASPVMTIGEAKKKINELSVI